MDEDQTLAAAVRRVFAGSCAVTCARNGKEGWGQLRLQKHDLIILDALQDEMGRSLIIGGQLGSDGDYGNRPAIILVGMKCSALPVCHGALSGLHLLPVDPVMETPQIPFRLLPSMAAAHRAGSSQEAAVTQKRTTKPHPHDIILCVDPDSSTTSEYGRLFAEGGWEFEAVPTLREAVRRMKQVKFGCIVVDVDLPDMAGYDAVSVIKTIDPRINIVVTARANTKELEARVRKEDIFYYYIKSFDVEELKLAVRSAIAAAHKSD